MKGSLHALRPHVGGQRSALAVAGLSAIFLTAAELAKPFPLKFIIDRLLAENGGPRPFDLDRWDLLFLAGVAELVLAIAVVEAVASHQMDLRLRRAGEKIAHSLRVAVYGHLQRLSLSSHEQHREGDLVTRATSDVNTVGLLFSESLGLVASSVLLLVGMVAVGIYIDPILALATFAAAPLIGVVTFFTRRRVKAASLATEERQEMELEAARIEGRFARVIDLLGAVGIATVLVVGVFRVSSGAVSPGDLVVMALYARRVHRPLRDLARQVGRISRALVRAERVAEILASDDLLEERPGAYRGPRAEGHLELDSVSFGYAPDRPVLTDLSLSIPAGQKVALAGQSGIGKSTVAALTARFYDPDSGRVLLDGRDLRDCSLQWLRDQVGLVLQETIVFTGTVAENIAYGTTADSSEVIRAAKVVGAHSFIVDLPGGYDAVLGPRGVALSGGQRQRIAIARTLLRDPSLLVLDEPTAALDEQSEAEVLAGLETLVQGRTTVIITHSPALERWADRVVKLDSGYVVDEPSPAPVASPPEARPRPRPSPSPASRLIPDDPALPQMASVLDTDQMAEVLQRALGEGAAAPEVGIRYLRYRPGNNLVVHYEVELKGGRHDATAMITSGDFLEQKAAKPESRILAQMVDGRSPSPTPLVFDPQIRCLIQWYPLDLSLPALATPPHELGRRFRSIGVSLPVAAGEPAQLAYKPSCRAVVSQGRHVLKCYAKDTEFAAAAAALKAASTLESVVVPRFEGGLASERVTAETLLHGHAVDSPAEAAPAAGWLLAALHAARVDGDSVDLPVARPERQLAAAAASAGLVTVIAPALQPRVEALLRELEQSMPEARELVPSHGDFNARQLLQVNGGLAVTDFDEFCLAPPALDVATYVAYVARGEVTDVGTAESVLYSLLDGYGRWPHAMSWYLSTMLLRRAPRPFRSFEHTWPDGVETMVGAAEEALRW
jgi:ATP-binding cassette subfamily B protein